MDYGTKVKRKEPLHVYISMDKSHIILLIRKKKQLKNTPSPIVYVFKIDKM